MSLEALEKKYEELGKEIEQLKNKPKSNKRWMPDFGEGYWFISGEGDLSNSTWMACNIDKRRYQVDNVFKTKEDALYAVGRRKAYIAITDKLRELEGDWVADWNDLSQDKYTMVLYGGVIASSQNSSWRRNLSEMYSSEESVEWVVNNMQKEIKLYFGINQSPS